MWTASGTCKWPLFLCSPVIARSTSRDRLVGAEEDELCLHRTIVSCFVPSHRVEIVDGHCVHVHICNVWERHPMQHFSCTHDYRCSPPPTCASICRCVCHRSLVHLKIELGNRSNYRDGSLAPSPISWWSEHDCFVSFRLLERATLQ